MKQDKNDKYCQELQITLQILVKVLEVDVVRKRIQLALMK